MVDTAPPFAATQDAIAAAQAREAAGAAQAAAINAAYMANTLPVLPKYAAGGGATYTAAELADAASEQAKHEAAFHPPDINYAAYANVPLSQMPENVASRVQEYYTAHPSERAQAITQQYAAQSNRVISTGAGGETSVYQGAIKPAINPFDPNSALGIAWEVGKTGGATDTGLNVIALGQAADIKRETGRDIDTSFITFATNEYIQRPAFAERTQVGKSGMTIHENAWNPEPIRRNITLGELAGGKFTGSLETGVHTAIGDWGGMYIPESTKSGASSETPGRLRGSNLVAGLADTNYEVVSDKGRVKDTVKTYVPFGSYTQEELDNTKLAIDKKTGEVAIYQYNKSSDTWSLIGGGGRNALQSGMFSVEKAMTPFVTTQEGVGKYERPSGKGMARLGAEGYGGVVRALDDRTLAPNEAISRYSGSYGKFNLANLVDQVSAGKAEEPGAHIHWTIPSESPAIQYMDKGGIVPGSAITVPSGGRLVGGKTVAGAPTVAETGEGVLPLPFKSTSVPSAATVAAREEYQPSGFLGLGGLLPEMPSAEKQKAFTTNLTGQIRADPFAASIKMASDIYAPPISTAAGVASRLSFGASEIIFKPIPITVPEETKETTKTEVFQLPTPRATEITKLPESTTISGGNQTINALGGWLTGARGSIDTTNKTAVEEYNKKVDLFAKMQEQNPVFITTTGGTKATVTETGGTRTVTTTTGESASKVYASEWDRFVEGSGRVARYVLGTPMAKQEAYFETIKGEQGIVGEAKRGLYFVGTTITNKPAELAPAAVLGFGIRGAAAMAPGFLGEVAAGSGVTAKAAQFLQTPGGVSLAKAGMLAGFGGAYVYDVTDKLTATAEKTKENIYRSVPALAAMYAGGGGFDELPRVSVDALRTLDRILPNIQQSPVRGQPVVRAGPQFIAGKEPVKTIDVRETIDLTKAEPREIGAEASRKYKIDVSNLPSREFIPSPTAVDITTKTVAKPIAYQPFVEGAVVGGKVMPRGNVRTGFGGTRGQPILEPSVAENIPTFDIRQKPQVVNLAEETLISRTAKGRKIETISPAQIRIARTSGETQGVSLVGMKNIQRISGAKSAKETAYQMKIQKQLPSVEGVSDVKFGSTADTQGRAVNSLRDAYVRAYPTMDSVVKQDIAVASISEAMRAAFPIMDTAVKQGTATEMIQAEKVHLASMEDAKPSLKSPTISENEKSPLPKTGWYPRNVNLQTPYNKANKNFVPYQRATATEIPPKVTNVYKTATPTEIPTITTKKTVEVVPYKTTTPKETQKTSIQTTPQEFPWTRTTEQPAPTKTITKLPPAVIPPLFPGLPSLGGGGGAGGGYKKGSRAYVEVLGFETSRGRKGAWTFGKRKSKK